MANGNTGGGSGLAGLSDLLGGLGRFFEKNPEGAAHMLGQFGTAIAGPETWQGRLGAAASGMAQNEQSRKFLSDLLGEDQDGLNISMTPDERTQAFQILNRGRR